MRISIIALLLTLSLTALHAQNRRQLVEFLVQKNDSLYEITQDQTRKISEITAQFAELKKQNDRLINQADSLNILRLTLQTQIKERDNAIRELNELKASIMQRTDSIAGTKEELLSVINLREQEATQMQQTIDSLQKENNRKSEIAAIAPPIVRVKGTFTRAYKDDCFHLIFVDENGAVFDFGNANNSFPFDVYIRHEDTGGYSIADAVAAKTVTITVALIHGITCDNSGKRTYELMPTVIDVQL